MLSKSLLNALLLTHYLINKADDFYTDNATVHIEWTIGNSVEKGGTLIHLNVGNENYSYFIKEPNKEVILADGISFKADVDDIITLITNWLDKRTERQSDCDATGDAIKN